MDFHNYIKTGLVIGALFIGVSLGKDLAQTLINKVGVTTAAPATSTAG